MLGRLLDWVARHRRLVSTVFVADLAAVLMLVLSSGGSAISLPQLPTNDLQNLLALTGTQTPARAPVQHAEPPLAPVPEAPCGAGSHPLAGEQGRVPASAVGSAAAARGWTCNLATVGHFPTPGGFRVWRYVDPAGHTCAYYDTSLFSPANVFSLLAGPSPGVVVLDMTDPAHPRQTDQLTSLPMQLPHESLNLNARRGLLAAEMGNGTSLPGLMSIYDVSRDCRHPVLDATTLAARFGHESGFSPDGRTFYIGGGEGIAAVDVSDPHHPRTVWEGNVFAHGLNVSDDGNTLYDSDPIDGDLIILDVSQIQARRPHPVVREISRLRWNTVSIPQNTDPMTINGHRYLLEFDEFAFRFNPPTVAEDRAGAARIINIDDPAHPRVVSNLRLQVNMQANHAAADGDPSPLPAPNTNYGAHYCQIPREVDPQIAACSFLNSGLRIFDIRDPLHPREVGYFVSPPKRASNGLDGDAALSQPAFDPARRQVWYTDATSGFYTLHLTPAAWPSAAAPARGCGPASGRLAGIRLGPLALGDTRAAVRRTVGRFSTHGRSDVDYVCLVGGGIRVGYPSAAIARSLRGPVRRAVAGRAVLLLSSARVYALRGVRPGARLAAARRRLRLGTGYRIGVNTWYLTPAGAAAGVLKVRGGIVGEVGILDRRLTGSRRTNRRVLGSFR